MRPPERVIEPGWALPDRFRALTTTRDGGVSAPPYDSFNLAAHVGDDPAAVTENRRRLLARCGCSRIQWLDQVHGTTCLAATSRTAGQTVRADAAWTAEPGLALAVLTADCLPVVLCAPDPGLVAVVHAGWRGLVSGVLAATLEALPVSAGACLAWIGPGIGRDAYEVGGDVADAVKALGADAAASLSEGSRPGKYQLDLAGLASRQLADLGVVTAGGERVCTASSADLYSYRRDGVTGRMATLAWIGSGG